MVSRWMISCVRGFTPFSAQPGLLSLLNPSHTGSRKKPIVLTPFDGADAPGDGDGHHAAQNSVENMGHLPPFKSAEEIGHLPPFKSAEEIGHLPPSQSADDLLPLSGDEGQDAKIASSEQTDTHAAEDAEIQVMMGYNTTTLLQQATHVAHGIDFSPARDAALQQPSKVHEITRSIPSHAEDEDLIRNGPVNTKAFLQSKIEGAEAGLEKDTRLLPMSDLISFFELTPLVLQLDAYMVHMCVLSSRNAAAYLLAQPRANPKVKQKAEAEQKDVMEAMDNIVPIIANHRAHSYEEVITAIAKILRLKGIIVDVLCDTSIGAYVRDLLDNPCVQVEILMSLQHTTSSLALSLNASLSDAGHDDELRAALMNKNLPFTPLRGRNRYQGHEMQKSNVMQRKTRMQMRLFYLKKDVLDPG